MKENSKKIGIMGGTFDPVHFGHLIVAEAVREEFQLNRVLFIPVGQPPHKDNLRVSSPEDRYTMLTEAVKSNSSFQVSRIEIDREGYTYTVDTLSQLKAALEPDAKLFFIIGADVIHDLMAWKNFQEVFLLCEFIAVFRPGFDKNGFDGEIERLRNRYMAKIHTVEVPLIDISSTGIRKRVQEGKSVKYLVPENVELIISKKGLYLY